MLGREMIFNIFPSYIFTLSRIYAKCIDTAEELDFFKNLYILKSGGATCSFGTTVRT